MVMKRVDLIGNSPYCLPYNSTTEYGIGSVNNPLIDICRYSRHL